MLTIGRDVCAVLPAGLDREWLVTNGLGGYASSSLVGANTRRYHGLLVAALRPPRGRTVMLAKIDEEVELRDRTYYLGTNEFRNETLHPAGFVHVEEVVFDGTIPTFRFTGCEGTLDKTVWMAHGWNTTYISYFLHPQSRPMTLRLAPFVTYRDHHREGIGASHLDFNIERLPGGCVISAFPGAVPLRLLTVPQAQFIPTGLWYWGFVHRREWERGLDALDDLYYPGVLSFRMEPGGHLTVIATVEPTENVDLDVDAALRQEKERQRSLLELADGERRRTRVTRGVHEIVVHDDEGEEFRRQLVLAADQFLVCRGKMADSAGTASDTLAGVLPSDGAEPGSVIAGYHWFTEWGRDTMIALPGLALATGRPAVAAAILHNYAALLSEGMLPNHFPEAQEDPEYNSVDSALWYFQALRQYLESTPDEALLRELFPHLADVIERYCRGTRHGIVVDATDGLLRAGDPGTALTWMDAKVDDWVVTPRRGKPVEVNALWCNAVSLMADWATRVGHAATRYLDLSNAAKASFAQRFWYEAGGYLCDVVDGEDGDDHTIRPNQIFAVSLPFSLLTQRQERAVVDTVASVLLTSHGLRSIDPDDPRYRRMYEGDRRARDRAYHQGAVWLWLIGPFVEAYLKVYGDRAAARRMLLPFMKQLRERGIGTLGEICDGQPPHLPRGCIAQAWSVAEVLRAWLMTGA